MRTRRLFGTTAALLSAAACASSSKGTDMGNISTTPSVTRKWVGSLQPTQQRTGKVAVTGQTRAFGSVEISLPTSEANERMKVKLTVSLPTSSDQQVRWAILPDRCGSGDLPVLGFEQFPMIELAAGGRGELNVELPLNLTANNTYHLNIYQGGQQLDNVVTCGNLKFEAR